MAKERLSGEPGTGYLPGCYQLPIKLSVQSIQRLDVVLLGLLVGPLTSGARAVSVFVPYHWISFPYLDCLVVPWRERGCV